MRKIIISDNEKDITFRVFVMSPGSHPSQYAPINDHGHPLVIISHGTGGTPLGYLTIAEHLANHGFVVAMPEHYRNNHADNSLEGSIENLQLRPRHISLVIDSLNDDPELKNKFQPDSVVVIGHSLGGYTALAVAGGRPWSETGKEIDTTPDSRIKALVLLAPATEWFMPEGSLEQMTLPIMMLTAEHDSPLPSGWHRKTADIILNHLHDKNNVRFRIIGNSGHFSFMSPYPEKMRDPDFLPSTDPAGFDRAGFHDLLREEILDFIKSVL